MRSKAELQTFDAVRRYVVRVLRNFDASRRSSYESGFQRSLEEFGNMLHPAGYDGRRSRADLINGLKSPPLRKSAAALRNMQGVRSHIKTFFAGVKKDPSDHRYLYGYEDAYWQLQCMIDKRGHATAFKETPE